MADGAKLDPQAAIAKQAAITQSGGDAAVVARVEAAIQSSPMGWLQGMMGEASGRAASEQTQVQGKIDESKDLVAKNQKDHDHAPAAAPTAVSAHPADPHGGASTLPAAPAPAPAAPAGAGHVDHKATDATTHKDATAKGADGGGKDAKDAKDKKDHKDEPPALGPPTHPAVPHPNASAAAGPGPVAQPAGAGGGASGDNKVNVGRPATGGAAGGGGPAPTIAAAVASAGGDSQLDGILNGYTPKSPHSVEMLGRIKEMGSVAQGFNGQLGVYVAQGGAVEQTIASTANFFGMGKDVSAVWAGNPYRKVSGILGGIMTGLSAVKNVCGVIGGICGKIGLVLTVIGLLGMIFPPIGVAVSGIARILNVIGLVCDAIAFVLTGILTGLNGVVLAQQISAGASAEEKGATAELMMSEANDAASGFVNLAMVFGPRFAKGLLGTSKGVVGSLMRRAKATIGRVSLKATGNIKLFANKVVRKLGFGGAKMSRVGGAWKDTGLIARTTERVKGSAAGKMFYGAPQHIESIQNKLMAKYGNTTWAKGMDRVGAWSGSVAHRYDFQEKVGSLGERAGKGLGNLGQTTNLGKSMSEAAERSELQTRSLAMKIDARDAAHLEGERWKNYMKDRGAASDPDRIMSKDAERKFIAAKQENVHTEANKNFELAEKKRASTEKADLLRHDRFERRNDEYFENETGGYNKTSARDQVMGGVHHTRETRWDLEKTYSGQEKERKALLANATRTPADETRLTALNSELKPLDDARRINKMHEEQLSGMAAGVERTRAPDYTNWHDVSTNVWDSAQPVAEMLHWKDQDSAWALAEKANLKKQLKFDKGAAKGNAAGRGGIAEFEAIKQHSRQDEMTDFDQFVRTSPRATTVSGTVRKMLANVTKRAPATPKAPAAASAVASHAPTPPARTAPTPATPTLATPAPATPAAAAAPAAPDGHAHEAPHHEAAAAAAAVHEGPPQVAAQPAGAAAGGDDAAAGEALPYWPAMLPEFDKASHDFGWMRNVAVEFKKAQITGKQQAVDTLAVYGRYQEYAKLRAAAAEKHKGESHTTSQSAQKNVDHAAQTEGQAGQGENKQSEAKSSASDRSAVDLPEPESRGFWGRILGVVKRWAKAKAAVVFGWIQEKIASVVLKGLCHVSMGDMREYAGALRHQQAAAHGVADGAAQRSANVQQTATKLGSDASKEAQGAADAVGECDRNIVDADTFMADVTSFEDQLAEEKAHAQAFIAQVHAAARTEQARQGADAGQQAQDDQASQTRTAQLGGDDAAPSAEPAAAATATAAPSGPAPDAHDAHDAHDGPDAQEPAPAAAPEGESDVAEIHNAASYVANEADAMASQLDARSQDYHNQLAVALTNHTGKDQDGHKLKGPSETASKHIVDEFKHFAQQTKHDMEGFHNMSIDPSAASRIADQIIQSAEHLEGTFQQSQETLDALFAKTYDGIRDGKRTLKSRVLDGDNVIGRMNHAGDAASSTVIDESLPAANQAFNEVAAPILPTSASA